MGREVTRRGAALLCSIVALASLAVAGVLPGTDVPTAGAAFQPPVTERLISGPTRPEVAAWGLAYNPVTDEMIVGDYVANQIRRYDRSGAYLGDFVNPGNDAESIVSAVAVDPRDGAVYAAATSLTSPLNIRKYDRFGNYMFGFNTPDRVAWLTVDDEGNVWFALAYGSYKVYKYSVDDATQRATQLLSTGKKGSGPGQAIFLNGIDASDSGDIYTADAINRRVHVMDNNGVWKRDIGGPSVFAGDLRGIVVDDVSGRVYVSDAKAAQIDVFDQATGNYLLSIGAEGNGPGQFGSGARQIAVTPDGHVWGADYSAFRVLEFDAAGTFLSAFPRPPALPDSHSLVEPWGLGVDQATGDVFTADHWGQRIQRFDDEGHLVRLFGRRGRNPEDSVNYPRAVATDPQTGHIWVLNAEGAPYLVEYDSDFNELRQIVTYDLSTGLEIRNGEIYVGYRSQGIQVFSAATGALVRSWGQVGNGTYQGLGVDPLTNRMWVPIRDQAQVRVLNPDGSLRWTLSANKSPTDVAFIGTTAYVTDTGANRVIAYDSTTGTRLGDFGSTGKYALLGPKGIDVGPDGKLYVSEVKGARVQVFAFTSPPPAETVKPAVTWAKPAANRANPPVDLTGTAADASGIGAVELSVQNLGTGLYWNVRAGTWVPQSFYNQATTEGPLTNPTWRFRVVPASYGESYAIKVRATDRLGNTKAVSGTILIDDVAAPSAVVGAPTTGAAVVPDVLPVTGTVTDDGFVDRVQVGLRDPASGLWWDPQAGWTSETWFPASLADDGTWAGSIDVAALVGSGPYEVRARATDMRGNVGLSPEVPITVAADTAPPDTAITVPTVDQQLPGSPTLTGTATDVVAVASVQVAVQNRDTGLWWDQASATWGPLVWQSATTATPGARTSSWSWTPALGDGFYFLQARTFDGAGLVDPSPAGMRFSVSTSIIDLVAPDGAITAPTKDQTVAAPPRVTGTATDDIGVTRVQVAIKDRDTNLWWNPNTGTWGALVWQDASLATPGATTTAWSWTPNVGAGNFYVQAKAWDAAKRFDATLASVRFATRLPGAVPWLENFDLPNGTKVDTGLTSWTLTTTGGVAEVRSNDLYFQTLGGTAEWRSEPLAVGALANGATVQVTWRGGGQLDPPDTITAFYRIDGGPLVQFGQRTDDFSSQTVSAAGLRGTTIEIIVRSYSTGDDENHIVSAVEVVPT